MPDDLPKIPSKRLEDYPALPFDTIRKPLDQIMIAMANLIEREWPEEYSEKARKAGALKILSFHFDKKGINANVCQD